MTHVTCIYFVGLDGNAASPRHHVPREWSQIDQEDRRPTIAYLWDFVALPHATQARAYIE
jgi:hypothetical protein